MKLFISADIEGTAGIVSWPETELGEQVYSYCANEMTMEVKNACDGAIRAGVDSILVKDAHDSARNINPAKLPKSVRILRGWTRGPECMMGGLDRSFDAVAMIGYHSACATNGNPLAHTMNTKNEFIKINGTIASEFMINAYTAAYYGIPTVFVSGDKMLCESAKLMIPNITTVPVSEGLGDGSISIHPAVAQAKIRDHIALSLQGDLLRCLPELPEKFEVEVQFCDHFMAYRGSFYPGAKANGLKQVVFQSNDYYDILKFFLFVL